LAAAGIGCSRMALADDILDIRTVEFASGLTRAKFSALLNQTFYLRDETLGTLFVKLTDVRAPRQPTNPDVFSLFFEGPSLPQLPAGTYMLEHYVAGTTLIYLEPANVPGAAPVYRADFCLLN